MDDFVISNLQESRNEWCSRLVSIFSPLIIEGISSIFNESWKMCTENDEISKYLMTFQNLLCRVPKWNSIIVEEECKRIVTRSGCNYLEDLITCVHIIQLKVLTSIRVGNKQKKIDIAIPKLDSFVHKVYIHVARKVYMNVYLFEKNITPLQTQRNQRELEIMVQECILVAIRESIPTESIIRAYMDESIELEEEVTIENINEPIAENNNNLVGGEDATKTEEKIDEEKFPSPPEDIQPAAVPAISDLNEEKVVTRLSFNDYDSVNDGETIKSVSAPKDIDTLEEISNERYLQRKLEEEEDEDNDKIKINTDEPIDLSGLDIIDIDKDESEKISLDFEEIM
jgi:hypothetical protein